MSGRRGQLTREQQAEAGAMVLGMHGDGATWKDLECLFHVERTTLWRWVRRHIESKMQQNSSKMQHQDCCVPLELA